VNLEIQNLILNPITLFKISLSRFNLKRVFSQKMKIMSPVEIFDNIVVSRRSTRPAQMDPEKKVDDEIVRIILTHATYAPNHGQAEPWQFTVFTGKGLATLGSWQSELYKETTSAENFKEATFQRLLTQPLQASHVIAIGMKKTPDKNIPEQEDIAAVACAVQNMYLSATAHGIGAFWSTGGVTYREKAKEFLELDANDKLLGFLFIGHIAIPSPNQSRAPIEQKMKWISE